MIVIYISFWCCFFSIDREPAGDRQYPDDQYLDPAESGVATRPGTHCHDGHRPVRQPRISGRTVQNYNSDGNHYINRHKVLQKGLRGHYGGQQVQPSMAPIKVYWKRKSCLGLRLGAAPLHRLWLGYWFLASSHVLSSCLSRRYIPFKTWLHKKPV